MQETRGLPIVDSETRFSHAKHCFLVFDYASAYANNNPTSIIAPLLFAHVIKVQGARISGGWRAFTFLHTFIYLYYFPKHQLFPLLRQISLANIIRKIAIICDNIFELKGLWIFRAKTTLRFSVISSSAKVNRVSIDL